MNEKARPSFSSDIYAFGCVCIEVFYLIVYMPSPDCVQSPQLFTLRSPFADVASDAQVIAMVMRGTSPCRPPEAEDSLERFWDIVEQCWNTEPHLRPSSGTLATILPLRVSALCTSKMKHHLHTEWEAPSSKLPVNHDTYILDSCLLNLLDLNALTSIHGLMTCLSSIHCPLEVLQYIEEILGKHEDNPVGGSYGCCQKFFREDGHKGHGANDLMVGIRWFQHMHGSMSIHANGDLGSPPGEAQQSHSLQEFPLVSSQSSQRPLPDQSTPYTNEPLHPTPNTHPTETQHRPKAQVPQGGYPPPLPYYRLVPKDLSYKIPHNFGLGSGVQPLRLTQNPHLDSPEASVQESMHKGKEPQSARVDVGVVVQGKLRTPQLYGRQHPIASVKTEAEYPGQRLRTGIGMQRSKGSTRLHGENAAQKRVQGFVGLRSRSASSVSGQYEVIVKSLRTGNTPHAKTFSSEVHDGGNAVGIGMRARQESGEKMQIKIGGFDGGRTSGTMVPEEQSQRVERGPQRNLAYPRRGSMGSAFYWFGSSSSINEDTN